MPKVTILLPVYNGANYLKDSIDSVLSQDFQDFELSILDDRSEDQSPQIAQSTDDPRVRYSRNPGRYGLYKTLNRGFVEATSSLVRIWAHDDIMLAGSLKAFIDFAQANPSAGMIYCDFFTIDENGRRTGAESLYAEQRLRTPDMAGPTLSALLYWCYGCLPGNISAVMLRKDAWQKAGGFAIGSQAPDYGLWARISEYYDVGFIHDKVVEVREHPLQLAKLGQKQLTTIQEELPIVRRLEKRLSGILSERELRQSWKVERGRQHVHWVARAILRGDITAAARGWKAIKDYGHPWEQVTFWLLSANGKLFMPNRQLFFDAKAPLCNSSSNGSAV